MGAEVKLRSTLAVAALLLAPLGAGAQEGDAGEGERLYRQCRTCHMIGDGAENRAGPHLNGLLGRAAASVEGFRYSPALSESGITWDADMIGRFIEDPRGTVPGTRMAFRGMADGEERADLIAYLSTFSQAAAVVEELTLSAEALAILEIEGDPAYGAYLSSECTACHKPDAEQGIPAIAGMERENFVAALVTYRDGTRQHQVMEMMANRLSPEEIAALAVFFEGGG